MKTLYIEQNLLYQLADAKEQSLKVQVSMGPELVLEKTFIGGLTDLSELCEHYPEGWGTLVFEGRSCEDIYHTAEVACVEGRTEDALTGLQLLLEIIETMEDGILKDRYWARYYMIDAITSRRQGDGSQEGSEKQKWFYGISEEAFKKAAEIAIFYKDLPTLLELQAHAVRTQMSLEKFTLVLASAVEALIYAGKIGRDDPHFFAKTFLAAKPSIKQRAVLVWMSEYFLTGCVQIVGKKAKRLVKFKKK